MPITDHYARLPLDEIHVNREGRQRKDLNTKNLIESIRIRGVLNPIIVERGMGPEGKHLLTAGERRYMACQELGLPNIPVRFADELSPEEAQIFELEENMKRQNLSWQDETKAITRIHALYCEMFPSWSQEKTAFQLGISGAYVSQYLSVAARLDSDAQIREATGIKQAYDIVIRKGERADASRMDTLMFEAPLEIPGVTTPKVVNVIAGALGAAHAPLAPPPEPVNDYKIGGNPAKNILLEDFQYWAPKYTGPAFNLIHCDFPYGIGVFQGPQSGVGRYSSYDDSRDLHFQLLETLLTNLNRLASPSCHIMYWFSMQHYNRIRSTIGELAPDLKIQTHPLVWLKTDNVGITSDHRRSPRHVYETALLMSRGDRPIIKVVSDAYGAPTNHEIHIHTKPEPMLRYFFEMLVDEYTVLLDPTCGSGSAIRAAESLGAKTVVGMDTDEGTVSQARMALRDARAKRVAASLNKINI